MPVVPDASIPSQQQEALPGRAIPRLPDSASPSQFGAGLGQGLETAGMVKYGMEQKAKADAEKATLEGNRTAVTDGQNQGDIAYEHVLNDPKAGALTRQGAAAVNLAPTYMPQFDAAVAKIKAGLANPEQQAAFQRTMNTRRVELQQKLDAHEFIQAHAYQDSVDDTALKIAGNRVSQNYDSPAIVQQSRADIAAVTTNFMERKGFSPDTPEGKAAISEALREQYSTMHSQVLDRQLGDGNIRAAKAYLDANKSEMGAKEYEQFSNTIDGKIKQAQNEQRQDIVDRYGDSLEAARLGLPGAIAVSRKEIEVAFPHDGQRRWDELMIVQGAGVAAKKYDQMTPDEIAADVKAREPTTGGPEVLYRAQAYDIAQRAADSSNKARNADPAQFAINSNRWQPLNFKQPGQMLAQITTRANTQDDLSRQVGVPMPLLSKDEAKALTSYTDGLNPTRRLQAIAELRAALPSDHAYTSLLSQIAPSSPLTAIAGATLDRPADAPTWYDPRLTSNGLAGQRILEGEAILRGKIEKTESGERVIKSTFPMPRDNSTMSSTGLDKAFQAAAGGNTDIFGGRAFTQEAYWAAYKAAYAAEANHEGKTNGELNVGIAQRAAAAVLGRITRYGITQVAVPSGMDPGRFEGLADRARDTVLLSAGYSDKDINVIRVDGGVGLRELGDTLGTGRYALINGMGDPLKSKDGSRSIIIDLNQQYRPGAMSLQKRTTTHTEVVSDADRFEAARAGRPVQTTRQVSKTETLQEPGLPQ